MKYRVEYSFPNGRVHSVQNVKGLVKLKSVLNMDIAMGKKLGGDIRVFSSPSDIRAKDIPKQGLLISIDLNSELSDVRIFRK